MGHILRKIIDFMSSLRDLPPLCFRLILAYGFYGTAVEKVKGFDSVVQWFGEGLKLPFPLVQAYLATGTEVAGVILLTLGLATRFISIPLMVIMVVAIATVHLANGFSCTEQGFEVPLYYFFMLFSLVVTGAGRFSVDYIVKRRTN